MRKLLFAFLLLGHSFTYSQQKQITLEDLYQKHTFSSENVAGFNSMKDGQYYTTIENDDLVKKSFATGATVAILARGADLKTSEGAAIALYGYELSADEKKLLLYTQVTPIYRRSSKAIPYVYDLQTKQLTKVSDTKVLHATFSPDATKVAYVRDNNLFYKDLVSGKETQVTTDGKWNHIINGNCDWVYEEEFEFSRAFQWSPKGDYLAYYKFDESQVKEYTMAIYDSLYPLQYSYKYPKAGENNSVVNIYVYNLKNGRSQKMDLGSETNQYIPRIKWTQDNETLCIYRMNRLQNKLELLLNNVQNGNNRLLYTEENKYYIEINDDLVFLKDGKHFLLTSEKDGYRHIYLFDMNGRQVNQLTKGHYDIASVEGIDENRKLVYYIAAKYSPMDRQLFAVSFNGKNEKQLTQERGWHHVSFSADNSYYIDNYSNINTPPVINLCDRTGKVIRNLKDNQHLRHTMQEYELSKAIFIRIPNSKGDTLNGWMLKPTRFDPAHKYPVLFCNYGGPGSQQVRDAWGAVSFWHQLLAEKGYVIVSVDNTGTGFRGEEFKKKTYLRLGELEIEDQIDAAKYLGTFTYIDKNRIGHWGWSFGGFMSALAITKGADVFKAAISVAPVTSWRYYDNIYTERFMRTPLENPKGYEETSPINFVDRIKGKYLIIHGTADDNVHFQNSVMMVDAMIRKNIPFESAYYPNKNHGIYGGNTPLHLWTRMTQFILTNL